MTSLFNYLLSSLWTYSDENTTLQSVPQAPPLPSSIVQPVKQNIIIPKRQTLISLNDLKKVRLNPVSRVIPGPARNMPVMNTFSLGMLNKAQLKEILSVQLRHIEHPDKKKKEDIVYAPKHPVLRELLEKIPKC